MRNTMLGQLIPSCKHSKKTSSFQITLIFSSIDMSKLFIKIFVTSISLLFAITIAISFSSKEVGGHNFYKNDASSFFTLITQAEAEYGLVQGNLPTDTSLALEHAENAAELLKDIFKFDKENSDDNDFSKTYIQLRRF
jgi:hypothetical protein